jgi:hypothetical protein
MLKSLYSPEFVGSACSIEKEAGGRSAVALLPYYPSYPFDIRDGAFCLRNTGPADPGVQLDKHVPLSTTFEFKHQRGHFEDRFFAAEDSFAESDVVEGSAVFFESKASTSAGALIKYGNLYFVKDIDFNSSPPFFSVCSHSGGRTIASLKDVPSATTSASSEDIAVTATFFIITEGTPVSFECELVENASKAVVEANTVVYAQEIKLVDTAQKVFSFRVSRALGDDQLLPKDPTRMVAHVHLADKSIRVVRWPNADKIIVRREALHEHPVLRARALVFEEKKTEGKKRGGLAMPETLLTVCKGADVLDVRLLHALSSFASACKFFDVATHAAPSPEKTFQERMLEEAARHMQKFIPSFSRDCGSVELVEYAVFRLLRLRSALHKSPQDQILKIVEVAWDVVNLYGCTVLVDSFGIHLCTQHFNSFCICDEKFVLVRNGFFVIGSAKTGECRSHLLSSALISSNPEPFKSVLRPCVVDAIFVKGSLYIIALLSPEADNAVKPVYAGIFKIHQDDPPVLLHTLPSPVGKCFPFLVVVPKFVIKPAKWTKYLLVFACGQEVPCIYRLSTSVDTEKPKNPLDVVECRLELPELSSRLEYLSFAMLKGKKGLVILWILIRHLSERHGEKVKEVKLFRFALRTNEQGSELRSQIVEMNGLKICDDEEENVGMWQLCLTNHGEGVGVASPQGDFYRLIATGGSIQLEQIKSPFRKACHVKYVC